MAAATKEQLLNQRNIRQELDNKRQFLTVYESTLADPILVRQDKIEAIRAGHKENEVTINELLLPQHSAAVGEIREAIKQQQATMTRLLGEARQAQSDLQQELDNALAADKQAIVDRELLRDQVREQSQALEKKKKKIVKWYLDWNVTSPSAKNACKSYLLVKTPPTLNLPAMASCCAPMLTLAL